MTFKANMMYHNQSCEMIVIGYHKNPAKDTIWGYSPEDSLGAKFLKTKNGLMAMDLFKTYIEYELCE